METWWKNINKFQINWLIDWFDFILWILPICIRFNGWMNGWSDSKTVVKAFARGQGVEARRRTANTSPRKWGQREKVKGEIHWNTVIICYNLQFWRWYSHSGRTRDTTCISIMWPQRSLWHRGMPLSSWLGPSWGTGIMRLFGNSDASFHRWRACKMAKSGKVTSSLSQHVIQNLSSCLWNYFLSKCMATWWLPSGITLSQDYTRSLPQSSRMEPGHSWRDGSHGSHCAKWFGQMVQVE